MGQNKACCAHWLGQASDWRSVRMEKLPFLEKQRVSFLEPRVLGGTQSVLDLRGLARCKGVGEHVEDHLL